jgi:hypothetical protein
MSRLETTGVGRLRFALGAVGAAVLGYGVYGLLTEPAISDLGNVGEWLVAGVVLHDAVLAPLVFAACALAYRGVGARLRGRLAALLLVGGSLVLVSVPALLQQGRNANPTVLPLDYARNLAVLLAVVVGAAALYAGVDARRRRRAARREQAAHEEEQAEEEQAEEEQAEERPEEAE